MTTINTRQQLVTPTTAPDQLPLTAVEPAATLTELTVLDPQLGAKRAAKLNEQNSGSAHQAGAPVVIGKCSSPFRSGV